MPSMHVTARNDEILRNIADLVAESKRIVIITGAGISTNCGIPDFRSKGGLYAKTLAQAIQELSSPTLNATDTAKIIKSIPRPQRATKIFDLFQSSITLSSAANMAAFNILITLMRNFIRSKEPTNGGTHEFIRGLHDSGRLLRCYTQNIDSFEDHVGLTSKIHVDTSTPGDTTGSKVTKVLTEVVPLHGSISTLRCRQCASMFPWDADHDQIFLTGREPDCSQCQSFSQARKMAKKRPLPVGNLRPNIVLYGEDHPQQDTIESLINHDIDCEPDTLIVVGTSMNTNGVQRLIRTFAKIVHRNPKGRVICVNRARKVIPGFSAIIDFFVNMDCDEWVQDLQLRRSDILEPLEDVLRLDELSTVFTSQVKSREEQEEDTRLWLDAFFG